MFSNVMQQVPVLTRPVRAMAAAVALGLLAACSLAPLDQVVVGERQVNAPSERQVKKLIEKKLYSKSSRAKVLELDVAESWFDRHGRFGLVCVVTIDGGPPMKPFLGYERIRVRILEVLLEQRLEEWRIKRMKALPRVHLLPALNV